MVQASRHGGRGCGQVPTKVYGVTKIESEIVRSEDGAVFAVDPVPEQRAREQNRHASDSITPESMRNRPRPRECVAWKRMECPVERWGNSRRTFPEDDGTFNPGTRRAQAAWATATVREISRDRRSPSAPVRRCGAGRNDRFGSGQPGGRSEEPGGHLEWALAGDEPARRRQRNWTRANGRVRPFLLGPVKRSPVIDRVRCSDSGPWEEKQSESVRSPGALSPAIGA